MTYTKKKLWLIILAAVFAGIVISVITVGTTSATTKSSFCLNCHDAPEFSSSMAQTPHGNLECLSCHGEGFVKDKINGVGHLMSTITGKMDPNAYHEYGAEVDSEKCLSCHNIENTKRDSGSVTMHLKVVEKDMSCTRCHDTLFFHGHGVE
ncbi:NapC/NirT family cytochrome c [Anaerobacillus sp. CMMVII]|uniref:NapC/NirT family cytochrome c n=1 Tax=Anaerobacillus sp. CMMVII TaxID=2755588 RepID=UPI0021B778F1|nr:NapC/NirT family cytochrome c [Anaerobacillus sp. CMMVII]MCT8137422.1 NapC/NirT family cytochrome c [Anaerobacillus sp. CMMVII]